MLSNERLKNQQKKDIYALIKVTLKQSKVKTNNDKINNDKMINEE